MSDEPLEETQDALRSAGMEALPEWVDECVGAICRRLGPRQAHMVLRICELLARRTLALREAIEAVEELLPPDCLDEELYDDLRRWREALGD